VNYLPILSLDDCNNVKISRTIDPYKISNVPKRELFTLRNVSCKLIIISKKSCLSHGRTDLRRQISDEIPSAVRSRQVARGLSPSVHRRSHREF
jgi:hypothetical protein